MTAPPTAPSYATVEITIPANPVDRVLIGSGEHCQVRISGDPDIAAEHAAVTQDAPGLYRVTDLGAGLRIIRGINDHPVRHGTSRSLVRGDWLIIGSTWLSWTPAE